MAPAASAVVVEERLRGELVEVDAERADRRRPGEVSLGCHAHVDDGVLAGCDVHDLGVEAEPDPGLRVVTGEAAGDDGVAGVLGDHTEGGAPARGDRHRVHADAQFLRGRDVQIDVDDRAFLRRRQLAHLHGDPADARGQSLGRRDGQRDDADLVREQRDLLDVHRDPAGVGTEDPDGVSADDVGRVRDREGQHDRLAGDDVVLARGDVGAHVSPRFRC